jgi:pilus assembly protein CpaB
MKPARLAVLGIALAAGAGAFLLRSPEPQQPQVQAPPEKAPTADVLVAAADIPLGNALQQADLKWVSWPLDSVPAGVIKKSDSPEAEKEIIGSLARVQFLAFEPIRRERLIKTDGTGFLSAVLPSGKRAVAISTDNRGANTAGGFILPNDRVDVIHTYRDEVASKARGVDVLNTQTIIGNVRVLAIGQNVQERNGEKVVVGETATLELDPRQVETVALAQKVGQLSLALRSLADAKGDPAAVAAEDPSLTLVRYGVTIMNAKP